MRVLGLRLEKPMRQMMTAINIFVVFYFLFALKISYQRSPSLWIIVPAIIMIFIVIIYNIVLIKLFVKLKQDRIRRAKERGILREKIRKYLEELARTMETLHDNSI